MPIELKEIITCLQCGISLILNGFFFHLNNKAYRFHLILCALVLFFPLIDLFSIWSCSLKFGCTTQIVLTHTHTHTLKKQQRTIALNGWIYRRIFFPFLSFYVMISLWNYAFRLVGWATILLQMVLNNVVVFHFHVVVFIFCLCCY